MSSSGDAADHCVGRAHRGSAGGLLQPQRLGLQPAAGLEHDLRCEVDHPLEGPDRGRQSFLVGQRVRVKVKKIKDLMEQRGAHASEVYSTPK